VWALRSVTPNFSTSARSRRAVSTSIAQRLIELVAVAAMRQHSSVPSARRAATVVMCSRSGPRSVRVTARSKRAWPTPRSARSHATGPTTAIGSTRSVTVPARNREGNSAGVGDGAEADCGRDRKTDDDPDRDTHADEDDAGGTSTPGATRGVKNRSRNDSCIRSWTTPR